MKNVFLLGDIYNEISEELYNEKLSRASRFEQQKQIYFDEIYKNDNSKVTIYNIYKKNILNWELILNKDLYEFDIAQLDELISSIPSSSIHIKASVYSFCNQYLNYCISKRIISMNNIKALDRNLYCEISQKLASSRLISEERLWESIKLSETKSDIQNAVPIVLAYFGCNCGNNLEGMRNLKMSDIDFENEVVYMRLEGSLISVIPVNKDFLGFIKKTHTDASIGEEYVDDDLIIKRTKNTRGDIVSENGVYQRCYEFYNSLGIKKISLNDLLKSRKIALLLCIRERHYLTSLDFQGVCSIFKPNCSRGIYDSLQKYYEQATGDVVKRAVSKEEELIDLNCKENYQKILDRLGWN